MTAPGFKIRKSLIRSGFATLIKAAEFLSGIGMCMCNYS
jgi:hypothetical protein